MVVKTGFKFGSHFRVYEEIPGKDSYHSRYLVHVLIDDREVRLPEISRAVRLAHGVRKEMVFAHVLDERVEYFEAKWMRL
jgi:tRNA-intron endonuclease